MLTSLGFVLLRQLADGAFHSGEDLAETVGMTRARVSQVLKEAESAGLALERIRGRGYRLLAAPDFLSADLIRAALSENVRRNPSIPLLAIEVVDEIGSTSTELLRRMQRKDIHASVLAAEWQTAGRGRRGRKWTAVAGGSLTFSMGWRFEQGAGYLAGLSLAVGVSVIRALEAEGLPGVELKWPNDLIHRHLKVGGILVELNGDALGPSTVVVGVGLNVRMPQAAKRDIEQPVTDLTAVAGRGAAPIDRNRLLARVVAELAQAFTAYAETGFPPFAAEWQRRHAYQGKPVRLLLPDGASVKGTVAGVDSTGALVLADGPRRARFLSGEISLRRA
ncbi:MAG TPA: biotin--[acetyl-CoA-carboxylase] ligase [Casimicrobiaceae bacterium]|nr:biotin--[acetyl-CoA-carboxylase] ligase [Casimicrobiaceae bacterium]